MADVGELKDAKAQLELKRQQMRARIEQLKKELPKLQEMAALGIMEEDQKRVDEAKRVIALLEKDIRDVGPQLQEIANKIVKAEYESRQRVIERDLKAFGELLSDIAKAAKKGKQLDKGQKLLFQNMIKRMAVARFLGMGGV